MQRLFAAAIFAFALGAGVVQAESPCAIPAKFDDGWSVAAPSEQGFDAAALCGALDPATLDQANIHSMLVERHGKLVAEIYREGSDRSIYSLFARRTTFDPSKQHDMRSVSKSIVGLLAGIAIADGAISLSAPVLDYFPELADLRTPERNAIKVEHLLTMSSGLHWEETLATYGGLANDETHLYWAWNPDRLVLSRALDAPPGTRFVLSCRSLASMCPACWCGERRWPRWFPRREFQSEEAALSATGLRGVSPVTDRTIRFALCGRYGLLRASGLGLSDRRRLRRAGITFCARHQLPGDARNLVGERDCREFCRLALQ